MASPLTGDEPLWLRGPSRALPFVLVAIASVLVMAISLILVHAALARRSAELAEEAARQEAQRAAAEQAALQTIAEVEAEPTAVSIDMVMIGDILMHDEIVTSGLQQDGSYAFDSLFSHIGQYIEPADLRILNQETVMGLPEKGYTMGSNGEGSPTFNTPIELIDAEMRAGFNVIIKATNHVFDQGYDGLGHELDYWHEHYPDVPVLGVDNPNNRRSDQDWVHNVYMYEKDGFKVAILNYTFGANVFVDYVNEKSTTAFMSDTRIRADVAKARSAGADMIVACPHWGIEYQTTPSAEELGYSQLFCELGVDVVFGTHPHIMQPVEVLTNGSGHQTICFYSNGNYVAWANSFSNQSMITGISHATLVKEPEGACRVEAASLVPLVINQAEGSQVEVIPLAQYSDDFALASKRPGLTVAYADEFCGELFGEGYDPATHTYTLPLGN